MKDKALFGLNQIIGSYDHSKGNADTGRVIRTTKEEVVRWPQAWMLMALSTLLEEQYNNGKRSP